ncbi:MAG TPA: ribbon-helix-helix domain-containing protein [Thermoanaerobaculia bacterium]|nr:ribbon-helix-helix domain-containing protein [Thermoanaerobaculia bacterium]
MRTSISIPDPLFEQARRLAGGRAFSDFVREALERQVRELERQLLGRQLEEGYQSESGAPSLDPAWEAVEVEGW